MTPVRAERTQAVVVGGGIFGCWLAAHLCREHGLSVVLLEREGELLRRASFHNQARVHNGYHYPRSLLTGLRSRVNSERFLVEFADCIGHDFEMYYAISRVRSNVTAAQFRQFCARIGAPLAPAGRTIEGLFDSALVEAVYKVDEWVFDADRLRLRLRDRLAGLATDVRLRTEASSVEGAADPTHRLVVRTRDRVSGEERAIAAHWVFNCTYSSLNAFLVRSGRAPIALRREVAELALVEVPEALRRMAVTLMCGPFFSLVPFPARGVHTLSHVRYTPHRAWEERAGVMSGAEDGAPDPPASHFEFMRRDAERYMPLVSEVRHVGSLFEHKAVLPQCEGDDSRPILFQRDVGLPGLTCVLGGKVDNVYDLERELAELFVGSAA